MKQIIFAQIFGKFKYKIMKISALYSKQIFIIHILDDINSNEKNLKVFIQFLIGGCW